MIADIEARPPRLIIERYEVAVVINGRKAPIVQQAGLLSEAREHAADLAKSNGLLVFEIQWTEKFPENPQDGNYVIIVRQDRAVSGWPQVYE